MLSPAKYFAALSLRKPIPSGRAPSSAAPKNGSEKKMNIPVKSSQAQQKSAMAGVWNAILAPMIADLLRLPEILPDPEGRWA